jgi:hypothetical protein
MITELPKIKKIVISDKIPQPNKTSREIDDYQKQIHGALNDLRFSSIINYLKIADHAAE